VNAAGANAKNEKSKVESLPTTRRRQRGLLFASHSGSSWLRRQRYVEGIQFVDSIESQQFLHTHLTQASQQRVETRFLSSRYETPTLLQFCCRHRAISRRLLMFARGSKPTSHGTAPCSSQSVARQPSRPSSLGSASLASRSVAHALSNEQMPGPTRHTLRSPADVPTANDLQHRPRACIRLYASSIVCVLPTPASALPDQPSGHLFPCGTGMRIASPSDVSPSRPEEK
jgi:hypothetical protein